MAFATSAIILPNQFEEGNYFEPGTKSYIKVT